MHRTGQIARVFSLRLLHDGICEDCPERNRTRADDLAVPEQAARSTWNRMEKPRLNDGLMSFILYDPAKEISRLRNSVKRFERKAIAPKSETADHAKQLPSSVHFG